MFTSEMLSKLAIVRSMPMSSGGPSVCWRGTFLVSGHFYSLFLLFLELKNVALEIFSCAIYTLYPLFIYRKYFSPTTTTTTNANLCETHSFTFFYSFIFSNKPARQTICFPLFYSFLSIDSTICHSSSTICFEDVLQAHISPFSFSLSSLLFCCCCCCSRFFLLQVLASPAGRHWVGSSWL